MKGLLGFCARCFFGGCLAVFGAVCALLVVAGVVWALVGPSTIAGYLGGHGQGPTVPAPSTPIPVDDLPQVTIWMTGGQDPTLARVTTVPAKQLPEMYVWLATDRPGSLPYQMWLRGPMGDGKWGPVLTTAGDGGPVLAGRFGTAMLPGNYTLEAEMGGTVVATFAFVVQE